ncbi:MAG: dTDP-4-dehydrorhamnose 3,5-epimerase [Candidatus Marinimicrobia bacterium]|nr:dTDP-4-dehydrorhamnose 3,5-epimerase [Candidatus Neomarinimicrobiota bacterium]
MYIEECFIKDLKILKPKVFNDDRGYFFESYNKKIFEEVVGKPINFVQDNQSLSSKNVLRGLHFQSKPFEQGKLVRVIKGKIFDVAVDIRKSSQTFKKWVGVELSSENKKQFWIPSGFAHGYLVLSDEACIHYKTTNHYSRENENTIIWNDESIGIEWPNANEKILSEKDKKGLILTRSNLFN